MAEQQVLSAPIEAYLTALPPEDLRGLIARSARKMDGPQRAQLALYLGYDATRHPIDEVDFGMDSSELRRFIEACPLLRERFAAFLTDNPQAIFALGKHPAEAILGVDAMQRPGKPRMRWFIAASAAAAIVAFAILPLAAEYAHQRGMNSGDESFASLAPPAVLARARPPAHRLGARPARATRHTAPARKSPPAVRIALAPAPVHHTAAAPKPHRAPRAHVRHIARVRHVRNNQDLARARFVVGYYLAAVMHGDTAIALMPLGLPADASPDAIVEHRILTPDSNVHIVSAQREADGRVRVLASIAGPRGAYSEVFYLANESGTIRIVDRYYSALAADAHKGRIVAL